MCVSIKNFIVGFWHKIYIKLASLEILAVFSKEEQIQGKSPKSTLEQQKSLHSCSSYWFVNVLLLSPNVSPLRLVFMSTLPAAGWDFFKAAGT